MPLSPNRTRALDGANSYRASAWPTRWDTHMSHYRAQETRCVHPKLIVHAAACYLTGYRDYCQHGV